eukprot:1151494-Pelagomonas_calceolata.AAC.5
MGVAADDSSFCGAACAACTETRHKAPVVKTCQQQTDSAHVQLAVELVTCVNAEGIKGESTECRAAR